MNIDSREKNSLRGKISEKEKPLADSKSAKKAFVEKWLEETEKKKDETRSLEGRQILDMCSNILYEYLTLLDPQTDDVCGGCEDFNESFN